MRVARKFDVQDVNKDDLSRAFELIEQDFENLFRAVNAIDLRKVESNAIPQNVNGRYLIYTSNAVADTDDTLNHQLGRTPTGMIQVEVPVLAGDNPNSGRVYFGSISPSSRQVTLRCTDTSKRCVVLLF